MRLLPPILILVASSLAIAKDDLYLRDTKMTDSGIKKLRKLNPKIRIADMPASRVSYRGGDAQKNALRLFIDRGRED